MGFTGRDVHLDVPLSNVAIAYRPDMMIADLIAPIVQVPKQSDAYYVWDIADAYRIDEALRAPATEANVITRNMSSGTFYATNYALKDRVPYEDIKNADAGFIFAERSARAEAVTDRLSLGMEQRVALQCTSGSNVGSYSAVGSAWTDYTSGNSDPIDDINTAINNVHDLRGVRPNSIIFGQYAWRHFREHAGVISRVFGQQTESRGRTVMTENAKNLFELDRILVGGAYYNSSDEGQSAALSQLWFDNVLVYYAPIGAPRKDKPSFMYSFRWAPIMNMEARVYDLPRKKAEEVEVGYYQDEKITDANLAFLITGVGSSQ